FPARLGEYLAIQQNFAKRRVVSQHRDESVPAESVARRWHNLCPQLAQLFRRLGRAVPNPQAMPGAYEGMGNPFAHISQANETDIHDLTPFVDRSPGKVCGRASRHI